MRSLRLSLRYGHGDLHWFDDLSHEDQVLVLAFEHEEAAELAAARRAAQKGPPHARR